VSSSVAHEGTGLGLYIVHQLVAGAGGTVRLARRAEGGTEITVTLPISDV
jgi:signal transduction histidine kinase